MKQFLAIMWLAALAPQAPATEVLDNVASEPVTIDGDADTIMHRALTCMNTLLSFDSAQGGDVSQTVVFGGVVIPLGTTQYAGGKDVVVHVDRENGIIVANHRFLMPGGFSSEYVQSRIIFQFSPGTYRTVHVQIQRMAKSSGLMENRGFGPVYIQAMSGHAKVRKALLDVSEQLHRCISGVGTQG